MTQRICSLCGARVAPSAERCRSCGGDPDLGPIEAGEGQAFRLSRDRGPPDPARWRRRVAVGAAVAVGWAAVALLTGGPGEERAADDADRTSTTRAAQARTSWVEPTSTTAEVIPGGPLLGEPSDLLLVAVSDSGSRVIDLDTGEVTQVNQHVLGVADRRLIVRANGFVALWPPPYDGSSTTTILQIPADGFVEQAWTVGENADETRIWLVQNGPGFERGPTPATVVLVDLSGRAVARLDLPNGFYPNGAVERGLVVSGPGGVYLLDARGAAERISTGVAWTVDDDRIVAFDCDGRLRCGVEVLDGRGRRIERSANEVPIGAIVAPDGRVAVVVHPDPSGMTSQVTVDGVPVFEGSGGEPPLGGLAWSPDGRWLAIVASRHVHLIDTLRGAAPVVLHVQAWSGAGLLHFALV